jgi:hypothetical protein
MSLIGSCDCERRHVERSFGVRVKRRACVRACKNVRKRDSGSNRVSRHHFFISKRQQLHTTLHYNRHLLLLFTTVPLALTTIQTARINTMKNRFFQVILVLSALAFATAGDSENTTRTLLSLTYRYRIDLNVSQVFPTIDAVMDRLSNETLGTIGMLQEDSDDPLFLIDKSLLSNPSFVYY